MSQHKKHFLHKTKGFISKTSEVLQAMRDKVHALRQRPSGVLVEDFSGEHGVGSEPEQVIHLSTWSLVKGTLAVLGVLLLVWFLYTTQHIVLLLFVSILFAAALDPLVDKWEEYRIPRSVSVLVCYLLGLFLLVLVVSLLVPMIVTQVGKFSTVLSGSIRDILLNGVQSVSIPLLPDDMEQALLVQINKFIEELDLQIVLFNVQEYSALITDQLSGVAGNFWALLTTVFNGLFNALMVLVLTFFLIVDKSSIRTFSHSLLPRKHVRYVTDKTVAVQHKIGSWVRGQCLLGLAVGLAVYIGLWILSFFGIDIPYKETLAVIAGLTEVVPIIGPILGMIPAVLLAANISFFFVLWVVLLYFIIQQLENNILVPIIMKHSVGLNPVVILVVMLIGAQFFGILGLLLAIPVATSLAIFVQDYANRTK